VLLLWALDIHIETKVHDPGRIVSADQIIDNLQSIFSDSNNETLDGSREWRLLWWDTISDYTLHGEYFWKGKGFGVNLADDDGFQVEADHSLRNPHNGHLTMLARGGVPMLVLWIVCQGTLGYGLAVSAWSARRRGDAHWFGLLAFLLIYWLAFLINASFDVFLEGPVGGIWFWCVYGAGIGAVWIYRNCPQALHQASTAPSAAPKRTIPALELCAS
jgi:O-antigen ligase